MYIFFTVTTIQDLPKALALRESVRKHHPAGRFMIGLADDVSHLPGGFTPPDDLIRLETVLADSTPLSEKYNPAEFVAAVKPLFLQHIWNTFPAASHVIYLAPTVYLYRPLTDLERLLADGSVLLTPHLLHPLPDTRWPDEKYFQNVGLYQAGFLALRRSDEANHFVNWWASRVPDRAFVDFCRAMCLDQIWLMLAVGFYKTLRIAKHPGWNVGLWNLHERLKTNPTAIEPAKEPEIVFVNFDGLINRSLLFDQQERVRPESFPMLPQLLSEYRQVLQPFDRGLSQIAPAYGRMPIRYPLPAWRKSLVEGLRNTVQFIDTVYVPRRR